MALSYGQHAYPLSAARPTRVIRVAAGSAPAAPLPPPPPQRFSAPPQQQQQQQQQPTPFVIPPSLARGARARAATANSAARPAHPRLPPRRRRLTSDGGSAYATLFAPVDEQPSALLQQLARCSASSDALIRDMRKITTRVDPSELLLQLSTRYLLVGRCDSRFAGIAKFLPSKVVYAFEHPLHRSVEMHMAYADMLGVRTQPASAPPAAGQRRAHGELRFRIGSPLSYFTREYDPTNEAHDLRIGFESEADFARFKSLVLPHIERAVNERARDRQTLQSSIGGGSGSRSARAASARAAVA